MKIVLISYITPASENIRGTSALPYHLMIGRPKNIDMTIFSFNLNHLSTKKIAEVEKELGVKIHLLSLNNWQIFFLLSRINLLLRVFLKYPILYYLRLSTSQLRAIDSIDPDLIWVYGEEMCGVANQFIQCKRIHTLPDSEALYYYRMLGQRFVINDFRKFLSSFLMYRKYLRLEKHFASKNICYHLVGEKDSDFLQNSNPDIDAKFIRHPHYDIASPQKIIRFSSPKIKLLIAGQYNFYMKVSTDELIRLLVDKTIVEKLAPQYTINFLGRGWETHADNMTKAGYEVNHMVFAENYVEEIRNHDIQITPISIGTGTKGKVLDAIANGLLVIGTSYALENIAVKNGVSCVEYQKAEEAVQVLLDIPNNISYYEQMAELGRNKVLTVHAREKCGAKLFSLNEP